MKKKLLIIAGVVFAVFFLFILLIGGGSSSASGVQEEQNLMISGITAEVVGGENKDYSFAILSDDIQFNSEIESAAYTKLKLKNEQEFRFHGPVFLIKTEKDCSLTFTLFKNEEGLKTTTANLKQNTETDINLILENGTLITTTDELYVVVK